MSEGPFHRLHDECERFGVMLWSPALLEFRPKTPLACISCIFNSQRGTQSVLCAKRNQPVTLSIPHACQQLFSCQDTREQAPTSLAVHRCCPQLLWSLCWLRLRSLKPCPRSTAMRWSMSTTTTPKPSHRAWSTTGTASRPTGMAGSSAPTSCGSRQVCVSVPAPWGCLAFKLQSSPVSWCMAVYHRAALLSKPATYD